MFADQASKRTPLFVRLPSEQAACLDDAARRLRLTKGLIVAQAISSYLAQLDEPVGPGVVDAATTFVNARAVERFVPTLSGGPDPALPIGIDALKSAPIGRHSFMPASQPDVLTLAELAELLSVELEAVRGLADVGELPGRKLGQEWRFSRAAVLAWLGGE